MADYYPLLARAVAGLPANTAQARGNVYERARRALLAQLRGVEPPLPEIDIERERSALEVAISRIELDYLDSDDPFAALAPPAAPSSPFEVTPAAPPAPSAPGIGAPTSPPAAPAPAPRIGDRLPERPAPRSFAERVRLELPSAPAVASSPSAPAPAPAVPPAPSAPAPAAPARVAAEPAAAPPARPAEQASLAVRVPLPPIEPVTRAPAADVPPPNQADPAAKEPSAPEASSTAATEAPAPAPPAAASPRVPFWSRSNPVRVDTPRAEPTLGGGRDEALRVDTPAVEAAGVAEPGAGAPVVDLEPSVPPAAPDEVPPVAFARREPRVPAPSTGEPADEAAAASAMPSLARGFEPAAPPEERSAPAGGRSLPLGGLLRRATAGKREPVGELPAAADAFPELRDGRQGYQPDLVFADPPAVEPEPRDGFDVESLDAEARVERSDLDWEVTEPEVEPAQPRRWGRLVAVLAVLALLGGGIALGFSQREKLIGWIGDLRSGTSQAVAPAPAPSQDQAAEGQAPAKSTDRVSQSPATPEPAAEAAAPAPAPVQPPAAPVVRSPSVPIPVNAQRAVLFEENPGGGGQQGLQQFVGTVVWSTESFDAGNGNGPDIGIRAAVEIPDRQIKVDLSLRRNQDQTLPASHIIELRFDLPADFDLGTVANVPGVRAKPTEGAQGVPLTGLAVRVTPGFFLVGLSALNNERQRNLALLITRNWLDIPLVFSNGRRGILALEKGPTGDSAFREAFSAWGLPIPQQTSRPAGQPADGAAAPAP